MATVTGAEGTDLESVTVKVTKVLATELAGAV